MNSSIPEKPSHVCRTHFTVSEISFERICEIIESVLKQINNISCEIKDSIIKGFYIDSYSGEFCKFEFSIYKLNKEDLTNLIIEGNRLSGDSIIFYNIYNSVLKEFKPEYNLFENTLNLCDENNLLIQNEDKLNTVINETLLDFIQSSNISHYSCIDICVILSKYVQNNNISENISEDILEKCIDKLVQFIHLTTDYCNMFIIITLSKMSEKENLLKIFVKKESLLRLHIDKYLHLDSNYVNIQVKSCASKLINNITSSHT